MTRSTPLSRAALLLAYGLFPLAVNLGERLGAPVPRNTIDLGWLLLALLALPGALRPGAPRREGAFQAAGLACLLALAAVLRFGAPLAGGVAWAPFFMELKPLFYLAAAWALLAGGHRPAPEDFVRCGCVLAALLLAETAAMSVAAGGLTRPFGSGEINYDAALLVMALCLGLDGAAPPGRLALLAAGVVASLSRTGMVSLGLVLALAALRRRPLLALPALGLAVGGVWASFAARDLAMDGPAAVDRYWMWLSGVRLLAQNPLQALAGYAPGRPLPIIAPRFLEALWQAQGLEWSAPGVFAYNFHALWLRLGVTWGLPALGLALAAALRLALTGPLPRRALGLFILAQGLTMGLFYLGNVAVPLWLALAAAAAPLQTGAVFAESPQETVDGPATHPSANENCAPCPSPTPSPP